jgi:drug/metabolite transporter (DMT)-like permease
MILPGSLLGIFFALTSAVVWGSGDFSGGLATRRSNQFQVLVLSSLSGIVILVACAALKGEVFPSTHDILLAVGAGVAGAVGLAAFYRALSMGHTASVAPTAAVIGAILPVAFSILTEGLPSATRLAGFGAAFVGIWLVSQPATDDLRVSRQAFWLACLAGVGFGAFFILIGGIEPGKVFTPLIVARSVACGTALLLLAGSRLPLPSLTSNPVALLAGVLDAGGNVFYVLARQYTRLDVAAVLSSLYPATTVILASILLKEKASPRQWTGAGICLIAIGLITI